LAAIYTPSLVFKLLKLPLIGPLLKLYVTPPPSILHQRWLPLLLVEISLPDQKKKESAEIFD